MSIARILGLEDDTAFAIALSDLVFARGEAVGFEQLTPAEQVAYCIDGLDRELHDGGFAGYFASAAGDQSHETVEALRWIGAEHTAKLLERAMAVFPEGAPSPVGRARQAQLTALGDADRAVWSDLDEAFQESHDNLARLMRGWMWARRGEFGGM